MIKTPVVWDKKSITIKDSIDFNLAFFVCNESGEEIVKRINMHDELVKSLDEMCGVWRLVCNLNGWDENHMSQYENAIKLLERCK